MNATVSNNSTTTLNITPNSDLDGAEGSTLNDGRGLFGGVFEHTSSCVVLTCVYVSIVILGNAAGGAIIAFEKRAGADMHRTLLNTTITMFFGNQV